MTTASPRTDPAGVRGRIARLSTGFKLFLLLSLALLPLALVVLFSAVEANRVSRAERDEGHALILDDGSRRLGARLATDRAALRGLAESRATDAECGRTRDLLQTSLGARAFTIVGRRGARCGVLDEAVPMLAPGRAVHWVDPNSGRLLVAVGGRFGTAAAAFDAGAVAGAVRGSLQQPTNAAVVLIGGTSRLPLIDEIRDPSAARRRAMVDDVPGTELRLELRSVEPPLQVDQVLLMLLPLAMWLAAAGIGWLVIDRLLLTPLGQLRAAVASYQPGDVLDPPARQSAVAREIVELGDTFRRITQMVATHEGQMADGLDRQRRLTREVHHRVKNNLQVVASLINIHARGAGGTGPAADAFATIQRRVDALAVVHRNHYAEMEVNNGVALRPLVGEIAANLRAGSSGSGSRLPIHVDVGTFNVTQDVAVPIAFIITELVELAIRCDAVAAIAIRVAPDADDRARLTIASPAYRSADAARLLAERYGRVLEGLARQLRTTLDRDPEAGSFSISFAILGVA